MATLVRRPTGSNLSLGNLRFRQKVFEPQRAAFEDLVDGQSPRALYIGCSDSRVVAEMILDVAPGELFVVRNIGAIVPHADDPASTSLGAALAYAVDVLRVPEVIVCGHDLCGALRAIVSRVALTNPHLERWLRKGSADVAGFDLIDHSDEMPIERLVERFVTVQLDTLARYDVVREAVAEGRLQVSGAVYDPRTGRLRVHRAGSGDFQALERADNDGAARPSEGLLTGA
jgi:carbonic anhydrase